MYKFIGKPGTYYKLNANCPDSEKSGTGPGSCGGKTSEDKGENPSSPSGGEKKGGGFLSKLFGGKKDEGELTIKKYSGKSLRGESDENLAKVVEESKAILENTKSSIADQKAAKENLKSVEYAMSFKPTSSFRGNYKTTRKY